MGTSEKRQQINSFLEALGWSRKQLAEVLYEEFYCAESEDIGDVDSKTIKKLTEKFKKQLQRDTTPEELLDKYLSVIIAHPDFQALGLGIMMPNYVPHESLGSDLKEELSDLSKCLNDLVQNSSDSDYLE